MRSSLVWLVLPIIQAKRSTPVDEDAYDPAVDFLSNTPRPIRVPFGHIFKEGIEDPYSDQKQPVDVLELHMRTPLTKGESEKYLREVPKDRIYEIDKRRYETYKEDIDLELKEKPPVADDGPKWFDFSEMQSHNMANPGRPIPTPREKMNMPTMVRPHSPPKDPPRKAFAIEPPPKKPTWTTCEEFSKKSSSFHPKDIVDFDWTPFYIWSMRRFTVSVGHKFTYPTKKLVKEYREKYGHLMNASIDWEQPKLVFNESIEMLLIADRKDRRGLFHGVPKRPIPKDPKLIKLVQFNVPKLRIKIVDPYLALMHCDEYYAAIMATPENVPTTDQEKIEEARILNFTGRGYPVTRDRLMEVMAKRHMEQLKKEAEQMKYIKAVNLESIRVDMDR